MFERHIILSGAAALAAFVAELSGASAQSPAIPLAFQASTSHLFSGFGVNLITQAESGALGTNLRQIIQDLDITAFRLGTVGGYSHKNTTGSSVMDGCKHLIPNSGTVVSICAGMSVQNMYDAIYQDSKALHTTSQNLASLFNGRQVHLVQFGLPSAWCVKPHTSITCSDTDAYRLLNTANIQDYANFVAAQAMYASNLGFKVTFVEPANEPEFSYNNLIAPPDYVTLLNALNLCDAPVAPAPIGTNSCLNQVLVGSQKLKVGIEGPGTAIQADASSYLSAMPTTTSLQLSAVSAHDYDTRHQTQIKGIPAGLTNAISSLESGFNVKNIPLFETELFINTNQFNAGVPPYDHDAFTRCTTNPSCQTNNSANSTELAVWNAAEDLKLYGDGANLTFMYECQDHTWEGASLGLMRVDGSFRPTEPALKTFLSLVPRVSIARVVGASSPQAGIVGDAFFTQTGAGVISSIVLAFANTSGSTVVITPQTTSLIPMVSAIGTPNTMTGASAGSAVPAANLANGSLTLTLPPTSIIAFTVQ